VHPYLIGRDIDHDRVCRFSRLVGDIGQEEVVYLGSMREAAEGDRGLSLLTPPNAVSYTRDRVSRQKPGIDGILLR